MLQQSHYQQDKNLDEHTLDQAGDSDRRYSNNNTAYYFYGNHTGKRYNWRAKTEDLNTYYFAKL